MIELGWWVYLVLALVVIGLAIWNYLKYGPAGVVRGTIVGLAIWILTPPYVVDLEAVLAVPLIPVFMALGFGLVLATAVAFGTIYLVAAVIVILHFFVIP